ncbi:2-deoxy-5-keto-D-gluconate 6-phosphate aldolase domain-containing protein [Candidatus Poriferisocius sp.]|uniref:2-deoxy-5-keto-D-gluconate 6-phosphate aldolase domain-containing protein n=1 Tax=Candidatus Poriferisocius sp. TaxID=3101276 RepID=UPI003B591EF1
MSVADLTHEGHFAVLAIDHRDSLRPVLGPDNPEAVTTEAIVAFKRDLVSGLAAGATGVMLEPEYSIPHLLDGILPPRVGFTAALEAQGYLSDPEAAPVAVLEGWSVQAAADCGAAAAKLLVLYRPDRPHAAAQEQAVGAILEECRRVGIPLLLEPMFYGLDGPAARTRIVLDTVDRFAPLGPDVLKLPFPVDGEHDPDRSRWAAACSEISARCDMPWTLLSGGGSYEAYRDQLAVAVVSGCAGFTAGRALWGDAARASAAERPAVIAEVIAPRLQELRAIVN